MLRPVDSINLVSLESEGEEKRGRKGGRLTARGPKRVIHRANPNPQGGIEAERVEGPGTEIKI